MSTTITPSDTSTAPGTTGTAGPAPAGPAPAEPLGRRFLAHLASTGAANLGDGIVQMGAPLVALTLTRSPGQISLLAVAAWLPWLLFGIAAGVVIDRTDRRRARVAALVARALLLAGAAAVAVTGHLSVTVLVGLLLAYGITEVFADLAGSSLVPDIVPRSRLQAANGRLLAVEQVANAFLGSPLAGAVLAFGTGWVFGVPAALAVAAALLTWRGLRGRSYRHTAADQAQTGPATTEPAEPTEAGASQGPGRATTPLRRALADVREGIAFLWHHPVQRPLLVAASVANMANTGYFAVFVLWVVGPGSRVGVEPVHYPLLTAVLAVGAVLGSFVAEPYHRRLRDAAGLPLAWIVNALLLLVPVVWPTVPAIALACFVLGLSNTIGNVLAQSMRQRMVPAAMLGRTGGAGRTLAFGLMPVGALLAGQAAERVGLGPTLVGAAALALASGVYPALRLRQRTIDAHELPV